MKALITIILLISISAQAQTTRCIKGHDGSFICTNIRSGGF